MSRYLKPVVLTVLALGLPLLASGCFPQRSTITQKASIGYLKFTGSSLKAKASSASSARQPTSANPTGQALWSFQTQRSGEVSSQPMRINKGEVYSLGSGPWTIKVSKNDQLIIEKQVIVSSGEAIEISLP